MSGSPTVELTDVVKRFRVGHLVHDALRGVSLSVDRRSRIGIVGESGSGKSTLVRILLGLEHPSDGQIAFRGRPMARLTKERRRDFRRTVQLVGQDTSSSFDPLRTLRDSVRRPAMQLRGMNKAIADAAVDDMLRQLNLDPALADRRPDKVSGGQRQRFAIARALIVEPEVIVCDEAVSALDVSVQGAVLNLLKDICEQREAGLVFVSHGLPATAFIADELIVMHEGLIVERGSVGQIMSAAEHPYTQRLIGAYRATSGDVLGTLESGA